MGPITASYRSPHLVYAPDQTSVVRPEASRVHARDLRNIVTVDEEDRASGLPFPCFPSNAKPWQVVMVVGVGFDHRREGGNREAIFFWLTAEISNHDQMLIGLESSGIED